MNVMLCPHLDPIPGVVHRMVDGKLLTICSIVTRGHVVVAVDRPVSCSICRLGMMTPDDVTEAIMLEDDRVPELV